MPQFPFPIACRGRPCSHAFDRLASGSSIPGTPEFVTFNSDQTYEVSLPDGKVGEKGTYKVEQSVFSIKNAKPVCGDGYWGRYKIDFYGEDSVHFTLIEDSCTSGRMDIVGYNPGLKRIKGTEK